MRTLNHPLAAEQSFEDLLRASENKSPKLSARFRHSLADIEARQRCPGWFRDAEAINRGLHRAGFSGLNRVARRRLRFNPPPGVVPPESAPLALKVRTMTGAVRRGIARGHESV